MKLPEGEPYHDKNRDIHAQVGKVEVMELKTRLIELPRQKDWGRTGNPREIMAVAT